MSPFEGTIWSQNYSELAFDKVKLGMSSEEVKELLGNPVRKSFNCNDICFWNYTRQETQTADFDQRSVVFNRSGKVIEIRKSFFID